MPWWGWLIGFTVVIVCITAVTVVSIMTRAMTKMSLDADASHERWRQQAGFGQRVARFRE